MANLIKDAESIDGLYIDTDEWLNRVSPINEEWNERVLAYCERQTRFSNDMYLPTIKNVARHVRDVNNRRERMAGSHIRWSAEAIACTTDCESDLCDNIIIYAISHIGEDALYAHETIYLVRKVADNGFEFGPIEARYIDVDSGSLDFVIGWLALLVDKNVKADHFQSTKWSDKVGTGYAANPTAAIAYHVQCAKPWNRPIIRKSKTEEYVWHARDKETGRTIALIPYLNLG